MPDLRFTPQAAQHTEIPRPKRAEGQWALGYTEPLNKNEQSKKDDDPLNVRDRILHTYSRRGFDSIDPADLRGRFRWMGLYTQRAPGFDGGKTAPARGGGARRPLLHDARAHRRRDPRRGRPPGAGRGLHGLRPQHRRHHRPQQHPVPLDRDRERPGDLGAPRGGRPHDPRGVRRQPAPLPRLPRRRHRQGRDHRRLRGARRDQAPHPRQPGVLQPAAQVQDRADRPPEPRRRARGQRRRVRRHRPPRARPRLRPLGRRRPVHQPDARPQARRLDPARRGGRRLGGRRRHLPRLRLPPPALEGPPEVPPRRLGQGEVPRGPGERVPPPRARRQPLPRGARHPRRPHRHPRAEGRPVLRRRRPRRGPHRRHHAERAGRPRRAVRRPRRPADGVPEARRDRRRGRGHRGVRRRPREDRPHRPPEQLAPLHDGLHRHRVLQARDRRHQGARPPARRRAREALPRPRHRHLGQRQRLPQRLRPHPGRRHRPQGPARHGRRRPPGRGLPGAPRRRARPEPRHRSQAARPQGHQRRPRRLRHGRRAARTSRTGPRASASPPGWPAPTRSCCAASRWRSMSERAHV